MRKLPNKAAADDSGPHARTAAYSLSAPTPHRRSNRKRAQWYGRWGITDADKPNTDKDAAGGSRFDYTLGLQTFVHDFVHRKRAYSGLCGSCVRMFAISYVE